MLDSLVVKGFWSQGAQGEVSNKVVAGVGGSGYRT
jgi:hypothetical protein